MAARTGLPPGADDSAPMLGSALSGAGEKDRSGSCRRRTLPVAALVLAAGACSGNGAGPSIPSFLSAEFVSAVDVPLSENGSIALLDPGTACVVDSYEFQVVCVERNGSTLGRFGRRGEGPGEFGKAFSYLNIFADTVHVGSVRVRHRLEGFDLFGPTLAVLVERPAPGDDPSDLVNRGIDWYRIELPLGELPPGS